MNHTARMHRLLRAVQAASSSSSSSHCMSSTSGSRGGQGQNFKVGKMLAPPAAVVMFGGAALMFVSSKQSEDDDEKAGKAARIYSVAELDKMVEKDGRIVVAYQGGLYDMTDFTGHPGGVGRLEMAAGNDLEVYWRVYTQHNRGHVQEHMRPYKIGALSPADMATVTERTYYDDSSYAANPEPYPDLLVNTKYPYNAEARLSELTDNWQTPIGKHFVRNHCAVPEIDPEDYTLTIVLPTGEGVAETTFTLEDLKTKFNKVDVTTVIQCNGNRREDFHFVDGKQPAFGPPHWVAGAMGNATWSGPRLRDVLKACGMEVDKISLGEKEVPSDWNVGLRGYDHDEVGNHYCCSFPFDKAVDPFGDVILAYQMNGVDIPRSYGYPVRAIVPGHAGARNCKFLERVTITPIPCSGDANWKQYAVHAPDVSVRKIAEFNLNKYELLGDSPVQEMPVQSMITNPSANDIIAAAKSGCSSVKVKGIAWGGGGSGVNRVDVSLDNGQNYTKADLLEKPIEQKRRSQWSWIFFEKTIPIPEDLRKKLKAGEKVDLTLTSKAFNAAWNMQPETVNWNAHGCCVNTCYKVPVTLCPKAKEDKKAEDGDFGNKPSGGKFTTPFRNMNSPDENSKKQKSLP